ncbi:MAG: phosphatidylglycerophosphate synthase [Pirellulaceae bacterium]|nr:MAG: phosphatidylglycerophosphate synthase [Pirellulaceae bacterium]
MNNRDTRIIHEGNDRRGPSTAAPASSARLWTIPNVLCFVRLFGAPVLLAFAWWEQRTWFVVWYLILTGTDWIDGKLAILLNQRSVYGARIDSWADATMYACLLLGGGWLASEALLQEWAWIASAVGSYAVSTMAGLWKFGKWPSYHTRGAKISWFLVLLGAVCLLLEFSRWPLRIAMVSVTLTNIEATMITWVLPQWHADVLNLFRARKLAKEQELKTSKVN